MLDSQKSKDGPGAGNGTETSPKWKLRTSSSIYPFEAKALKTWKIENYNQDLFCPLVYFGCYHLGDYESLFAHIGPKAILWAGSDILNLRKEPTIQAIINRKQIKHYCENIVEQKALREMAIEAEVVPSFLEDVNEFKPSYMPSEKMNIYLCGHKDREDEYGRALVERIAPQSKDVIFHIYGFDGQSHDNIVYHGRVSAEQFNAEIKSYQGCLRANDFDGCSELVVKAALMGQYVISRIPYPGVWYYETDKQLVRILNNIKKINPDTKLREYFLSNLNQYSWVNTVL